MPDPGKISTFTEFDIPAGTSAALRTSAYDKAMQVLDGLVPGATRDSWLNKSYSGGATRSDLCSHGDGEVSAANATLSMSGSTSGDDSYCYVGSDGVCYTVGDLLKGGSPVEAIGKDGQGNEVTVRLRVVVALGLT